jgi:hypothetical protein
MNTKNKKKNKNKKTKKRGGSNPLFIKTNGYYNNGKLVDYRFLRNNIDKDQQKKYAKKHMVYYPTEHESVGNKLNDLFNISNEQKETIRNFLKPDPNMVFTDVKNNKYYKDNESIVVHDKENIKRINITNKLINKLNTETFDFTKNNLTNNDCRNDLQQCIKEYNNFIDQNKNLLLSGIVDADEKDIVEKEFFVSPVFFYIIGKKLGFANCEIDDLDLDSVKKKLDEYIGRFKTLLKPTSLSKTLNNMTSAALNAAKTNAQNTMNTVNASAVNAISKGKAAVSKLKQNKIGIVSSPQPDVDANLVTNVIKPKPRSKTNGFQIGSPKVGIANQQNTGFTGPKNLKDIFTKKKIGVAGP